MRTLPCKSMSSRVAVFLALLAPAMPLRADVIGCDTTLGKVHGKWDGEQIAMHVYLPTDATITSITAYIQAGPPAKTKLRYALYADAGGEPDALLAQTAVEEKGVGNIWRTLDLPDTYLEAGNYWIAATTDHQATKYRYDEACGRVRHAVHDAIDAGFRATWGPSTVIANRRISMYATAVIAPSSARFEDVSGAVGFNVVTTTSEDEGSGVHWADFDDDGDLDCIVTGDNAMYMRSNDAGASFTAITLGDGSHGRQGALLDADNDGDIDFWHRDNTMFLNDGSGGLADAGHAGFNDPIGAATAAVAAGDMNGDGWCDLVAFSTNGNWIGHHDAPGAPAPRWTGTSDISFGLDTVGDYGNGGYCATADVNNDGATDIFYDFGNGRLFRSNGDGTYTSNAGGIGVASDPAAKVGSAWGDYDNDGDLDLFIPGFDAGTAGSLWRQDNGLFANVAASSGLGAASAQRSACWGDYDNDGDLDLYVVTRAGLPNRLYRNTGAGSFVAVDDGSGIASDGHDAAFVDYDNDGDLDLALTNGCAANVLLRNTTDDANYLKVRAVGWGAGGTDVAAIGTRVELYASDGVTLLGRRDIGGARGFGGTECLWVHFGGVNPGLTYVVKVFFRSRVCEVSVEPGTVSTVIGGRTIPQMVTIEEPRPALRVLQWHETDPVFP